MSILNEHDLNGEQWCKCPIKKGGEQVLHTLSLEVLALSLADEAHALALTSVINNLYPSPFARGLPSSFIVLVGFRWPWPKLRAESSVPFRHAVPPSLVAALSSLQMHDRYLT